MAINIDDIKKLREETGAGILEVKKALEAHNGSYAMASADLMKNVAAKAAKKQDRVTKDGLVSAYIHAGGKLGSLVCVACETDFVAKTDDFQKLVREIAMQACSEDYADVQALLDAEYLRDGSKKISDLIAEATAKVGEKIELRSFVKFDVRA